MPDCLIMPIAEVLRFPDYPPSQRASTARSGRHHAQRLGIVKTRQYSQVVRTPPPDLDSRMHMATDRIRWMTLDSNGDIWRRICLAFGMKSARSTSGKRSCGVPTTIQSRSDARQAKQRITELEIERYESWRSVQTDCRFRQESSQRECDSTM